MINTPYIYKTLFVTKVVGMVSLFKLISILQTCNLKEKDKRSANIYKQMWKSSSPIFYFWFRDSSAKGKNFPKCVASIS